MSCTKHVQRKRPTTCPDCAAEMEDAGHNRSEMLANTCDEHLPPVVGRTVVRSDLKTSVIRDEIMDARQALVSPAPKSVAVSDTPKAEERKYIRVLIEAEIERALSRIKQELKEIQNITWEHLDIPLGFFSITLMHTLGSEGWCYKDTYRGEVAKASGCKEDTVIMTRIKNPNFPAKPDFSKRSVRERYAEKV